MGCSNRVAGETLFSSAAFRKPFLHWPETFAEQGAIRVVDYEDIKRSLSVTCH
jgi:hypothetical protein